MRWFVRPILLTFLLFPAASSFWAHQDSSPCGDIKYEDHNMIDYGPLRISGIHGETKDSEGIVVPHACVGLFSEADHKTVATAQADSEGHFEIQNVPNGKYRLVVTSDGFCVANAPAILRKRSHRKKKLVVTLKPSAIDVCSFIEWK